MQYYEEFNKDIIQNGCYIYEFKKSKDSDIHLSDKINRMSYHKRVTLSNLNILASTIYGKLPKTHIKAGNVKAPMCNGLFKIPDGLYNVSDNQDSFEHFNKICKPLADNPPIRNSE